MRLSGSYQDRGRDANGDGIYEALEISVGVIPGDAGTVVTQGYDQLESLEKMMAAEALEAREAVTVTYDDQEIPETVAINALMDQYEAVKLPHRKIVNTLFNNIKNNKLANYFHHEKGTMCQGCHHNSPASKNPPKCAACHNKSSNESELLRPGLKVAYHQQCMGCHDRMGIEKPESTSCTECHKIIGVNKLL